MSQAPTMRAVVRNRFGPPETIEIVEVPRPTPDPDQVLVRVHAASLNRADWYAMAGRPLIGRPAMGWRRPKSNRLGTDYAGVVEEVGANVTGFRPGDLVFGARDGSLAEYTAARHDRSMVLIPEGASAQQAAAVPVAALTALQALRDQGMVTPGEQVLIHGASGGVGTFAVQIAKALGAEVTAVCGPRGVEAARSGGADRVVDYTREDFTRLDSRFDLVIDIAGTRPWRHLRRVLKPRARVVIVGGPKTGALGPLRHVIAMRAMTLLSRRRSKFFISKFVRADMELLAAMLGDGRIRPVIDRTFRFDQSAEAFRYMEDGHPQGKVVITVP